MTTSSLVFQVPKLWAVTRRRSHRTSMRRSCQYICNSGMTRCRNHRRCMEAVQFGNRTRRCSRCSRTARAVLAVVAMPRRSSTANAAANTEEPNCRIERIESSPSHCQKLRSGRKKTVHERTFWYAGIIENRVGFRKNRRCYFSGSQIVPLTPRVISGSRRKPAT